VNWCKLNNDDDDDDDDDSASGHKVVIFKWTVTLVAA